MLKCKDLRKNYKGKCAVDGLSFNVKKGEVFAFLGSNGAGKTTTIKMILGLVHRDGGEIKIAEGATIGYSPETPYFPPFMTGRGVLRYYADIQKLGRSEREQIITELLSKVGLEDSRTRVKNYSKGMLQRLALAQAMLGDPDLLILDEPTAGLDALGRTEMMLLIGELKKSGKTIIINSHILNDIERICDRGIIIKSGVCLKEWTRGADSRSLEEIFVDTVGGTKL